MKDPYEILGVPKTATADDIRAAFRKLAKKHHPDLNPGDKAAEAKFKEIGQANDLLSDAEKRRRFDAGEIDAAGQEMPPRGFYRDEAGGPTGRKYRRAGGHESFVDILLISQLPWEMKWLSKHELFRLPVVGWLMRMANDIPVDRRDRASGAVAMAKCARLLEQHVSVMIFPEGKRSTTGGLLPFRDGAFRLAIQAQVPILPLAVHGAATALRTHSWRFGRAVARVQVLEPISTTGLTVDDIAQLRDDTRDRIGAAVQGMLTS